MLYSYYTAGSGGVGPTILETSLLLAGTPVTVYANGEKVALPVSQHASCSGFGKCKGTFGRDYSHSSAGMLTCTFLNQGAGRSLLLHIQIAWESSMQASCHRLTAG